MTNDKYTDEKRSKRAQIIRVLALSFLVPYFFITAIMFVRFFGKEYHYTERDYSISSEYKPSNYDIALESFFLASIVGVPVGIIGLTAGSFSLGTIRLVKLVNE